MNRIKMTFLALLILLGLRSIANEIDSTVWSEMRTDYQYDPPKSVIQEIDTTRSPEPIMKKRPESNPIVFQALMYVGIVVGIGLLLLWLSKQDFIRNKFKKGGTLRGQFDEENPDELILDELERELERALEDDNYNRCLRYLFLLVLERLESRKIIKWHKYTTNGEYLMSVLTYSWYHDFERITYTYEYYWYGEHVLSKDDFDWLRERINTLMVEISE